MRIPNNHYFPKHTKRCAHSENQNFPNIYEIAEQSKKHDFLNSYDIHKFRKSRFSEVWIASKQLASVCQSDDDVCTGSHGWYLWWRASFGRNPSWGSSTARTLCWTVQGYRECQTSTAQIPTWNIMNQQIWNANGLEFCGWRIGSWRFAQAWECIKPRLA
jgi:hypothetical protein